MRTTQARLPPTASLRPPAHPPARNVPVSLCLYKHSPLSSQTTLDRFKWEGDDGGTPSGGGGGRATGTHEPCGALGPGGAQADSIVLIWPCLPRLLPTCSTRHLWTTGVHQEGKPKQGERCGGRVVEKVRLMLLGG